GQAWVLVDYHKAVELVHVDLTSNKVLGKPIGIGRGNALDLAIDDGTIWVANIQAQTVVRVDAKSRRVIGSPIRVGPIWGSTAARDGPVWAPGVHDLTRTQP